MSTRDRLGDIDARLQIIRREQVHMQAALEQLIDLGTMNARLLRDQQVDELAVALEDSKRQLAAFADLFEQRREALKVAQGPSPSSPGGTEKGKAQRAASLPLSAPSSEPCCGEGCCGGSR